MTTITVSFPGGVAVDATLDGHTIHTDQPRPLGEDSAMSPFDLFLSSIAACMGFYALRFCQERGIDSAGLGLTLGAIRDETSKRITTIKVDLRLPEGFPEKYHDAVRRAMELCSVKRHLNQPPDFEFAVS